MFCYWYQHSASPSVTPFNKDFQSLLLYLVFYKDSDMITVFPSLWSKSIVNEFISESYFDPMESKLFGNDMPAHEYHVRVDCAKMICLYRLCFLFCFFPFFFSFSIYMLLYKQRGLWRTVVKCWR